MTNPSIHIKYDLLRKPKAILLTTGILVIIYNSFAYLHPASSNWLFDRSFTWSNLFRFVVLDQFLIETITIGILFFTIRKYAYFFNLTTIHLSFESIAFYNLKFFPVWLTVFFVFNPVTQTVRFFVNEYPNWSLADYQSSYFYSWRLYLTYLPPISLAGASVIAVNLVINYQKHLTSKKRESGSPLIVALDDSGEVFLKQPDVIWIEKIERYYYAFTDSGRVRLKQNYSQLETLLDPGVFLRVNRAVIVNIKAIKNYSYWENDKYILRLNNDKEFVMPRQRLKVFKETIAFRNSDLVV